MSTTNDKKNGVVRARPTSQTAPSIRTRQADQEASNYLIERANLRTNQHSIGEHTRAIYDLVTHPTKPWFLTASRDRTARLWDAASGACLTVYKGHRDYVRRIYVDRAGQNVLTVCRDQSAKRWQIETGKCVRTYMLDAPATCGHLHAEAGWVAAGGENGVVALWDWNGQRHRTFQAHSGGVGALSFSHDGKFLFSAGADGLAKMWDASSGKLVQVFSGHDGSINDLCVSGDQKSLFTGGDDSTVRRWNVQSAVPVAVFKGHIHPVVRLELNDQAEELLSTSKDCTVRRWCCRQAVCLSTHLYSGGISRHVVVEGGRKLIAKAWRTLALLDATSGECLQVIPTSKGVTALAWSKSANRCIAAEYANCLNIWDLENNRIERKLDYSSYVNDVSMDPSGTRIVTAGEDGTARIWDYNKDAKPLVLDHRDRESGAGMKVYAAAFASSGKYVVTGCRGISATLRVWDAHSGKRLRLLNGHRDTVLSIAISETARVIVSGGADGLVRLWKIDGHPRDWHCQGTVDVAAEWAQEVAVSDDGKHFAVSSNIGKILIGHCETGSIFAEFDIGQKCCAEIAFDERGNALFVATRGGANFVWCLTTKAIRRQFTLADIGLPRSAVFTGDTKKLIHATAHAVVSVTEPSTDVAPTYRRKATVVPGICSTRLNQQGDLLGIGSYHRGLRVLNIKSGQPQHHGTDVSNVKNLRFGPNDVMGVVSDNDIPKIYRPPYVVPTGGYNGHTDTCTAIVLSNAGTLFFSASEDSTIREWFRHEYHCNKVHTGHSGPVLCLALDLPDEVHLYSGGEDHTVRQWFIGRGGGQRSIYRGHNAPVRAIASLPFSNRIVSGDEDGTIIVWNTSNHEPLQIVRDHSDTVRDLTVSRDGRWLLSASDDWSAKLWRIEENAVSIVHTFNVTEGKVASCDFVPETDRIILGGWDGTVRFLSLSRYELLATCHVLTDGYLWTTPPDDFAPCGWLHTNRLDLVDLISRDSQGFAPEAVTDAAVRRQYFSRYHDAAMVMNRIHDYDRYVQDLESRMRLQKRNQIEYDGLRPTESKQLSREDPIGLRPGQQTNV